MRKIILASFAMTFVLTRGVAAASAPARPVGAAPTQFAVEDTFSNGPGETGAPSRAP